MSERPLTKMQQMFVDAYKGAAMGNATEACRLAGYRGSDATLAVRGSQLIRTHKIIVALATAPLTGIAAEQVEPSIAENGVCKIRVQLLHVFEAFFRIIQAIVGQGNPTRDVGQVRVKGVDGNGLIQLVLILVVLNYLP